MDAVVRTGELVVSRTAGDTLTCAGLGSCVAVAAYDRLSGVGGVAHVMLPQAPGPDPADPGKYADLAVPALVQLLIEQGAVPARLEAVLVGGAAMFDGAEAVGRRNIAAISSLLTELQIPVVREEVGGSRGRNLTLAVSDGMVTTVRESGPEAA